MVKKTGIVLLVLILAGMGAGFYFWNKPAPKAENQNAVAIEAQKLFNAYAQNEKQADSLYLGKWLEINGSVQSMEVNQEGQSVLYLETGDIMESVMCVMRDKNTVVKNGQMIAVKGICTGKTTGVSIKDCILLGNNN